ncbi:MAG: DNA/RNA non-specific endonuclease [Prevotella sp.]|nr:DNA/RNA non-specific endonuclease [Prevotella sp.]
MKKTILIIVAVVVLLFVVAMCISGRARDERYGEPRDVDAAAVDGDAGDTAMPDSVVRLLMVAMPDSVAQQLLVRKAYVCSYNKETRCPNWVAWHLTAEHVEGPYRRERYFHEDESVAAPRATLDDYRGSGWTRGHLCPAGDNKWDRQAMYESFSLTNVCPQDAKLNNGLWNSYEMDCRRWARMFGDIYIVTGPLFMRSKQHETIGNNSVAVPEAFFKVVLCLTGKPKAFGFIARNGSDERKQDIYIHSIDEVERIMGMDFFAALPDDIENVVEAEADMEAWR